MPEILTFIALLLLPSIWFLATFNRFVRIERRLDESWADVDVLLKRRRDLVPKLVSTIKGYAAHETHALERLVSLRAEAMAERERADVARRERELEHGLAGVFSLVEAYPGLRGDAPFLGLQRELASTEDRIAVARQTFNDNVRELNDMCDRFPTSSVASMFGFKPQEFFEVADPSKRRAARADVES